MSKELIGSFVRIKSNGHGRQESLGICSEKRAFTGQDLYFVQTAGIENQYAREDEMEVIFSKDAVIGILKDADTLVRKRANEDKWIRDLFPEKTN